MFPALSLVEWRATARHFASLEADCRQIPSGEHAARKSFLKRADADDMTRKAFSHEVISHGFL